MAITKAAGTLLLLCPLLLSATSSANACDDFADEMALAEARQAVRAQMATADQAAGTKAASYSEPTSVATVVADPTASRPAAN
jgi:hypothetical protein